MGALAAPTCIGALAWVPVLDTCLDKIIVRTPSGPSGRNARRGIQALGPELGVCLDDPASGFWSKIVRSRAKCDIVPSTIADRRYLMTPLHPHDPPEATHSHVNGLRVLVVEDSWQVGTGLKMLLEAWGADVIGPVATPADAVRLISERAPDVALVDINLRHGERSYGLIDHLHELGIRTVVITGYADVALAEGKVAVVLQKPMREDLLLASLRPEQSTDGH